MIRSQRIELQAQAAVAEPNTQILLSKSKLS